MSFVAGLGERGQAIWGSLESGDAVRDALALELARTADRLDELDEIIQGKGVLNLMQFRLDFPEGKDEPYVVEVKFQNVLAEARQQQMTLAQLVQKLVAGADSGKKVERELPGNVTPLARLQEKLNKKA